ncbi:integrin alpha-PS1-like, partial [Ruditapes philippinarum]|uniref:integrin alpha-PS1-like n=1 Tax=Ruditapes philippinarum TaxID=129788 RepID=UPI00295B7D3D
SMLLVDIIYTIIAEPGKLSPRVEFMKDGNKTQEVKNTFTLYKQRTTGLSADDPDATFACISHTAYLKTPIIDVWSAIEFGINFALPEKDPPVASSPDTLPDINEFPILDAGINSVENQMVMTQVEFLKKCGDDQICNSNLQMKVSPKLRKDEDGKLVLEIGRSDIVRVEVDIENMGEIAYQTEFYLSRPKSLTWQQSDPKDIGCDVYNDTLIKCQSIGSKDNGNPLKAGAVTVFALLFQVDRKAIATVRSIQLTAWVNTTSVEVTPAADKVVIPIVVYVNADLQVFGIAEPDSAILYSGDVRGESAIKNEFMIGKSVNHTYT